MTLNYFLSDHLGSTSITADAAGVKVHEQKYKPCPLTSFGVLTLRVRCREGETRYSTPSVEALTKYQFTGQYNYEPEIGLQFYNARFYDSTLGRFISADSIIPTSQGLQAWDRYAYVNNNPVNYTDPTGHMIDDGSNSGGGGSKSPNLKDDGKDDEEEAVIIPDGIPTPPPYSLPTSTPVSSNVSLSIQLTEIATPNALSASTPPYLANIPEMKADSSIAAKQITENPITTGAKGCIEDMCVGKVVYDMNRLISKFHSLRLPPRVLPPGSSLLPVTSDFYPHTNFSGGGSNGGKGGPR